MYITDIAKWCEIDFAGSSSNPMYYAYNLYVNDVLTTDLVIPDDVTKINKYAFYGCGGLTSVTIGNSVSNIDEYASGSCSGLERVVIPESVAEIEPYAFDKCSHLTTVQYCGNSDKWNDMYIGSGNDYLKNADIEFNYVME